MTANVIGAGHNGLAAAITLARAGVPTTLYEARPEVGGLARTVHIGGFAFDVGASILPMTLISPALSAWPLAAHGARWITPAQSVAHAFDPRQDAAVLRKCALMALASPFPTAPEDGPEQHPDHLHLQALLSPLLRRPELLSRLLVAQPDVVALQRYPLDFMRFGLRSLRSAQGLAATFESEEARLLWLGMCAHGNTSLNAPGSAATGLPLCALALSSGWPLIAGGTGELISAMRRYFEHLGGQVVTGVQVDDLDALPRAELTLLDTTPAHAARLLGPHGAAYARLTRHYRPGRSVTKLDYALSGPMPWTDPALERSAALHLGRPGETFVIAAQPSRFDTTRAPAGQHTFWMYGQASAPAQEALLDRFAPGWRDLIVQRHLTAPQDFAALSPLAQGGDILSGETSLPQMLARPWAGQHRTTRPDVFLCSAASVPGPGLHGMGGYNAAQLGLRWLGLGGRF